MPIPFRIVDGTKSASFDGLILEVSGVSGSADSKRLNALLIEDVTVAVAGDEWMFIVKSTKGGFGVVISEDKKAAWEELAAAITEAHNHLAANT